MKTGKNRQLTSTTFLANENELITYLIVLRFTEDGKQHSN